LTPISPTTPIVIDVYKDHPYTPTGYHPQIEPIVMLLNSTKAVRRKCSVLVGIVD